MDETRSLAREVLDAGLLASGELLSADAEHLPPPTPNGYEIERPIGRGGAGSVFLARDTSLHRPVAIKFLHDAAPADVERFRREARFTARLDCPSIVKVYELGEVEGQPYIAMQYLEGGNLATVDLDHGGLVRAVRAIAGALQCAHSEGIVHRDVKPQNILFDGSGQAYIADFGIARDLCGAIGETMSHRGQIIGTPGLMPPEQARGDIEAVDARSDVYTLGATLYVALTGRYPFSGESLVEVLHAAIHEEPALPRSLEPSIPRSLESIVVRCMRKRREDRYQTMEQVVVALEAFLAGAPGEREPSAWFRRLVDQRDEAPDLHDTPAEHDVFWTEGVEIMRDLAAWDARLYRVTGSLAPAFAQLDALIGRLDALIAARPDMAWARFYRGVALFRRGRLRPALEEMERAIDRVRNLAGAYFELGRLYLALYLREHHEARKHLAKAGVSHGLSAARSRLDQAAVALGEAQRRQGELEPWHREYARAVEHLADGDYGACVATCDEALGADPDVEEVWKLRGDALRLAGEDAIPSYDRALEVRRSYHDALHAKAEALLAAGDRPAARATLERACEVNPEFAAAMSLLARIRLAEAREGGGRPDAEILDDAARLAGRAFDMRSTSYDAAVVLAEAHIERGLVGGAPDWFEGARTAIESASRLEGCQNRVKLLTARSHLARAREVRAAGGDPSPHLAIIDELASEAHAVIPDGAPWGELREAAAREFGGG